MPASKKKKQKKFNPAKTKRKLDRLYSQLVLRRDRYTCQWCGASKESGAHIDNSHVIPRESLSTRWNPDNSLALCFKCHKRRGKSWHGSPLEAVWWLRSRLGDQKCAQLIELGNQPFELTPETAAHIEKTLKAELARLDRNDTTNTEASSQICGGQILSFFEKAIFDAVKNAADEEARNPKHGVAGRLV